LLVWVTWSAVPASAAAVPALALVQCASAPPSPRLRQLGICRRVLILAACLRVVFGFWLSYGRVARPEVRAIYGQP